MERQGAWKTARSGVNFVRTVVEGHSCSFQEIPLANDVGDDAYFGFFESGRATGCCIAVQIKAGASYIAKSGQHILKADKQHFDYWAGTHSRDRVRPLHRAGEMG